MQHTMPGTITRRTATAGIAAALTLGLGGVGATTAAAAPARPSAGGPRRVTSATVTAGTGADLIVTWAGERVDAVRVFASTDPRDPEGSGRLVATSADTSVVVPGLDPARRWYFAVRPVNGGKAHGLVTANRQVVLQGAINTRDLGGYETRDGGHVAWGQVYRADALAKLSGADVDRLAALGLRTVVDFRGAKEVEQDGVDRVPPGVNLVQRPILDPSGDDLTVAIIQAIATGDNAVLQEYLGDGKGFASMAEGHRTMVLSELGRTGYGETMRRIADPAQTPLLYHCTAGKDRTGIMSALVLLTVGVPEETVLADYLLSNDYRRASNEATYAYLRSRGIDAELLRPVSEQCPEYLIGAIDAIRAEYGDFDNYLLRGLGLTHAEIRSIRRRLVA